MKVLVEYSRSFEIYFLFHFTSQATQTPVSNMLKKAENVNNLPKHSRKVRILLQVTFRFADKWVNYSHLLLSFSVHMSFSITLSSGITRSKKTLTFDGTYDANISVMLGTLQLAGDSP